MIVGGKLEFSEVVNEPNFENFLLNVQKCFIFLLLLFVTAFNHHNCDI